MQNLGLTLALFAMFAAFAVFAVMVLIALLVLKMKGGISTRGGELVTKPPIYQATKVYFARPYLFSPGEAAFFRVLMRAAAGKYLVMGKVRLADVIEARGTRREWGRAFGRIKAKHVDFVLLNPQDFSVGMVVELDDRSHARVDRQERDNFLEGALREAGVRLLRVRAAAGYEEAELVKRMGVA